MDARNEILQELWADIICHDADGQWLDNWIQNHVRETARDGIAPFCDAGDALIRLRQLGATHQDLASVVRAVAFDAVFQTLYKLDYFEVTPGLSLYESLLSADPSGREGRPSSAA